MGKRHAAVRAWRKCIDAAARLKMPYEEALAHAEIGRCLPAADAARSIHLAQANDLLAAADASFDLTRLRQELRN
jgi:hypothetical protein